MLQKFVAFIFIAILINACCASKPSSEVKDPSRAYNNFAESKLGSKCKILFNSDSTYFAAYASAKNPELQSNSPLKFFIYDIREDKILFEDNLPNGEIKWLNESQLKISTIPGIVSGIDDQNRHRPGYIYDVNVKRKIKPDFESKEQ
ncbi:MAG TPA: hypothetical protein VMT35_03550 [Ignavibacteriaceae bacterium]|nr:hypothetical protein [Ignavibacteriaceae bacterium]